VKEVGEKTMCTEDSMAEVIKKHSDMVYRLAYSLVKNRYDAEDIYQEVFICYVKRKPGFHSPEHEKAWFLRVTINRCKNLWKSPWMRRRVSLREGREQSVAGPLDEEQALMETLKQLPEKYRAVIHLFYYERLSVEEIGEITGAKASTVRTRLTRARRLLKEKWED